MTRFEALTKSPETLAAYIEGLVCYLLEAPYLADVERRTAWLNEEKEDDSERTD